MPCQCQTAAPIGSDPDATYTECACATESGSGCACGSTPTPLERERSLERVVMELDKRVRQLERQVSATWLPTARSEGPS